MKVAKKDRATEHAKLVVSGVFDHSKIPFGRLHYLACKRHLKDLDRQRTDDFPYFWDIDASEKILDFAETLTIAEGEKPKPVKLKEFQYFIIGSLFGWKKLNGYRRFRRSYVSMARQQGKSFINGIMGSYIALFGNYSYGKLFTASTKRRQARIAWEEIAKFINIDEDLQELFEVKDYKSLIVCNVTNCTIEALSKEGGLEDGHRSIFSSLDELHQIPTNHVYKALYNGTRALMETLVSMITTRGFDMNTESFSFSMDNYAVSILEGTVTAEDFFADIYCLDKGDDIFDENNYIKANPYLATFEEGMEILRQDAQTAKDMGGAELRDFKTKSMNIWARDEDTQFIDLEKWQRCGTNKTLKDFDGCSCFCGLDLSSGGDLTTLSLEFPNNDRFYIYSHSFMPKARLQEHIESDLAPYDIWEQNKLITVTGGADDFKNDYKFIIKHLKELIEEYHLNIKAIGYDPHNADAFLSDLEELGIPLIEITQSAKFLNDATSDMQLNVKSEKIEYDKTNELLSWSFSNAKTVSNSFGEIKVDKEKNKRNRRIDPVDACINAHVAYMKFKDDIDIDIEMEKYLEAMEWR